MNTYDEPVKDIQEQAEEKMSEMASTVKEQAEIGKRKLQEVNERTINYVRENPWMSLSISLGIGALLGFLCRSRSS